MKKIRNWATFIGVGIVCYDMLKYFSGLGELQMFISCLFIGAILALGVTGDKAAGRRSTINIRFFRERVSKHTVWMEALISLFLLYLSVLSVLFNEMPRTIGLVLLTIIAVADTVSRWLELRKMNNQA
jgi:hypothetical protein